MTPLNKAHFYEEQKEFGGIFKYTEILELIKNGAKPSHYTNDDNYYQKLIESGKNEEEWFYFTIDK